MLGLKPKQRILVGTTDETWFGITTNETLLV